MTGSRAAAIVAVWLVSSAAQAFDLQGHRGARGLAPENTIEGFARALSIGVTTLELDVGMSKDDVVVVHHDIWLNPDTTRGPDGRYLRARGPALRSLTLAELKRYDVGRLKPGTRYARRLSQQRAVDGARIPTLAEVFELARKSGADHVRFNIETKITPASGADTASPEAFALALATAVRAAKLATRVSVQSFDWRTLAALRRVAPEFVRGCLTRQSAQEDTIQRSKPGPSPWTAGFDVDSFGGSTAWLVAAAGCDVWSPRFQDISEAALAEARLFGLKVVPWTVNGRSDLERLVALRVDGIITDYPDRLRAVLAAKGIALPPPAPLH